MRERQDSVMTQRLANGKTGRWIFQSLKERRLYVEQCYRGHTEFEMSARHLELRTGWR